MMYLSFKGWTFFVVVVVGKWGEKSSGQVHANYAAIPIATTVLIWLHVPVLCLACSKLHLFLWQPVTDPRLITSATNLSVTITSLENAC